MCFLLLNIEALKMEFLKLLEKERTKKRGGGGGSVIYQLKEAAKIHTNTFLLLFHMLLLFFCCFLSIIIVVPLWYCCLEFMLVVPFIRIRFSSTFIVFRLSCVDRRYSFLFLLCFSPLSCPTYSLHCVSPASSLSSLFMVSMVPSTPPFFP